MNLDTFTEKMGIKDDDYFGLLAACTEVLTHTKYYKGKVKIHFNWDSIEFWFSNETNPPYRDIHVMSYDKFLGIKSLIPR